jgi:hypothetical protein
MFIWMYWEKVLQLFSGLLAIFWFTVPVNIYLIKVSKGYGLLKWSSYFKIVGKYKIADLNFKYVILLTKYYNSYFIYVKFSKF